MPGSEIRRLKQTDMQQTKPQKQKIDLDVAGLEGGDERAAMAAMYEETLRDLSEGSIVKGRIIEVRESDVLVDVGYKSEGLISSEEFENFESLKPGDELEVLIESLEDEEGMVVLSKRAAEYKRNWDRVFENYSEGGTIRGVIKGRVKGGLIVDVGGVDAFLPGSQLDVVPVSYPDDYMGKEFEFKIVKINKERRNIVLSRRELLEERRREQKKKLLEEIQVGQIRKGVVKNITDFGAFVDLSGMDGLLHVTDMSWGRVGHPSDVVKVGQEIEVVVLDVSLERERISLGLKQKTPNPWEDIEQKYPIGSRVRGRVVNLMPYGAFVELEDGVEGLVHVSEMSWTRRIGKASDILAVGDVVEAVVLNVNKEEQKISLGIRQTEVNPWDLVPERYPIGARVKGKVRNFTNYGAFVELEEGIDGMIHVSDLSWTRKVSHPSEMLKKGETVECVVLEVDVPNRRISLGLKQAQEDPWAGITERYQVGQIVKGKVTKLASFGAFVEIEEGIEGLVHIGQISEERVENVADVLTIGQEVEARVVRIDPVDRRIGLSIKAAALPDEEFKVDEEMLKGLRPDEELVDLAGAFDQALGGETTPREWHPGEDGGDEER